MMNRETFERYLKAYLIGECPVCDKVFLYVKAGQNHFNKNHEKESEEFTNTLLNQTWIK